MFFSTIVVIVYLFTNTIALAYYNRLHILSRPASPSYVCHATTTIMNTDGVELNEVWLDRYLSNNVQQELEVKQHIDSYDGLATNEYSNTGSNETAVVSIKNISESQSPAASDTKVNRLPLPFFDMENIGFIGGWQEKHGNYLLYPPDDVKPVGVVHFLGGAFVGAAPHIVYRYLLESLAQEGYIVVTTPYRLDLDYLKICDGILFKFDAIGTDLAEQFGPLPVVGLGHSLGAVLQSLITALFPDTPRAVNILISFNNKPAKEAIPGFNELIVPIAERVMDSSESSVRLRKRLSSTRNFLEKSLNKYAKSRFAPAFVGREIVPLYKQGVEIVDQIPELLQSIAEGGREFEPSPLDVKESLRRMYRARRTLVLKFENDSIDESEEIAAVLREANTIMRMKRPMINMQVDFKEFTGSHVTPLTPNLLLDLAPLSPVSIPDPVNPAKATVLRNAMKTIDNVKDEIVMFLGESIKRNVPLSF